MVTPISASLIAIAGTVVMTSVSLAGQTESLLETVNRGPGTEN